MADLWSSKPVHSSLFEELQPFSQDCNCVNDEFCVLCHITRGRKASRLELSHKVTHNSLREPEFEETYPSPLIDISSIEALRMDPQIKDTDTSIHPRKEYSAHGPVSSCVTEDAINSSPNMDAALNRITDLDQHGQPPLYSPCVRLQPLPVPLETLIQSGVKSILQTSSTSSDPESESSHIASTSSFPVLGAECAPSSSDILINAENDTGTAIRRSSNGGLHMGPRADLKLQPLTSTPLRSTETGMEQGCSTHKLPETDVTLLSPILANRQQTINAALLRSLLVPITLAQDIDVAPVLDSSHCPASTDSPHTAKVGTTSCASLDAPQIATETAPLIFNRQPLIRNMKPLRQEDSTPENEPLLPLSSAASAPTTQLQIAPSTGFLQTVTQVAKAPSSTQESSFLQICHDDSALNDASNATLRIVSSLDYGPLLNDKENKSTSPLVLRNLEKPSTSHDIRTTAHPSMVAPECNLPHTTPAVAGCSSGQDSQPPTSTELDFQEMWPTTGHAQSRILGMTLHILFPRKKLIVCNSAQCSFIARGNTWQRTVSAATFHYESAHNVILSSTKQWCATCRSLINGSVLKHSCLFGRPFKPIVSTIKFTCFLCPYAGDSGCSLRQHLRDKHNITNNNFSPPKDIAQTSVGSSSTRSDNKTSEPSYETTENCTPLPSAIVQLPASDLAEQFTSTKNVKQPHSHMLGPTERVPGDSTLILTPEENEVQQLSPLQNTEQLLRNAAADNPVANADLQSPSTVDPSTIEALATDKSTIRAPETIVVTDGQIIFGLPLAYTLKCPFSRCKAAYSGKDWSTRKCSMIRHIKDKHGQSTLQEFFVCSVCSSTMDKLNSNHPCLVGRKIVDTSVESNRFECPKCSFSCPTRIGLTNHQLAHKKKDLKQSLTTTPTTEPSASPPSSQNVDHPGTPTLPDTVQQHSTNHPLQTGSQNASSSANTQAYGDAQQNSDVVNQPPPSDHVCNGDVPDLAATIGDSSDDERWDAPLIREIDTPPLSLLFYDRLLDLATQPPTRQTWLDFQEICGEIMAEIHRLRDIKLPPLQPTGTGKRYEPQQLDTSNPSKVQKAYRRNRKATIRALNGNKRTSTPFTADCLEEFFSDQWREKSFDSTFYDNYEPLHELSLHPLSKKEIRLKLFSAENTSPGPDAITYQDWREVDPEASILAFLLNICLKHRNIPSSWKKSRTVLIPKKDNPTCPSDMRPISLLNTVYKILARCLSQRLIGWVTLNKALSFCQKGFLPSDGVFENNFILNERVRKAKEDQHDLCVAWLDIASAFSSVPHSALLFSLERRGIGQSFIQLIRNIYQGASTRIFAQDGLSAEIPICSGVRQGCPLSGILFNLAIDPVIRKIQGDHSDHKIIAFADDLVLLARSPTELQQMLDTVKTELHKISLRLNSSKCTAMHLSGSTPMGCRNTQFHLDDQTIPTLQEGQFISMLGRPFTVPNIKDPSLLAPFQEIINNICRSQLAPWQKLDALRDFFFPAMNFPLRNQFFLKKDLDSLDNQIKLLVKDILYLPRNAAPPNYIWGDRKSGCLGLPFLNQDSDIAAVDGAFKLLTSPDPILVQLAMQDLVKVVRHKYRREPSLQDIAYYLSGFDGDVPKRTTNRHQSTWTSARISSRSLKIVWEFEENGSPTIKFLDSSLPASKRNRIMKTLRDSLKATRSSELLSSNAWGRSMECVAADKAASHFLYTGDFTSFADWRFVHRARLGLLALKGCKRWVRDPQMRRCRRCRTGIVENVAHVLHHCMCHARSYMCRHNSILKRLISAATPKWKIYSIDSKVGTTNLKPDLILMKGDSALILDVTIIHDNRLSSFHTAREEKVAHYQSVVEHLKRYFKTVQLDAIILGGTGSWDPANDRVMLKLCSQKYLRLFKKLAISDVISWSRRTYTEHVSGRRQYTDADEPRVAPINPAVLPLLQRPTNSRNNNRRQPQRRQQTLTATTSATGTSIQSDGVSQSIIATSSISRATRNARPRVYTTSAPSSSVTLATSLILPPPSTSSAPQPSSFPQYSQAQTGFHDWRKPAPAVNRSRIFYASNLKRPTTTSSSVEVQMRQTRASSRTSASKSSTVETISLSRPSTSKQPSRRVLLVDSASPGGNPTSAPSKRSCEPKPIVSADSSTVSTALFNSAPNTTAETNNFVRQPQPPISTLPARHPRAPLQKAPMSDSTLPQRRSPRRHKRRVTFADDPPALQR